MKNRIALILTFAFTISHIFPLLVHGARGFGRVDFSRIRAVFPKPTFMQAFFTETGAQSRLGGTCTAFAGSSPDMAVLAHAASDTGRPVYQTRSNLVKGRNAQSLSNLVVG